MISIRQNRRISVRKSIYSRYRMPGGTITHEHRARQMDAASTISPFINRITFSLIIKPLQPLIVIQTTLIQQEIIDTHNQQPVIIVIRCRRILLPSKTFQPKTGDTRNINHSKNWDVLPLQLFYHKSDSLGSSKKNAMLADRGRQVNSL